MLSGVSARSCRQNKTDERSLRVTKYDRPIDLYKVSDAVPPIHAVSSHVATDKRPSKFRSIFSDNLQPIATRGKKARGTLLVDIGCSSKRAPLSASYYNEISGSHIGSCRCSEEGLCRPSTVAVLPLWIGLLIKKISVIWSCEKMLAQETVGQNTIQITWLYSDNHDQGS